MSPYELVVITTIVLALAYEPAVNAEFANDTKLVPLKTILCPVVNELAFVPPREIGNTPDIT